MLEAGKVPIYEPGLDELMAKNVAAGRLSFSGDLAGAVDGAEAIFIAVGTPTRRGDGHADLTYVMAAAAEIAQAMTGYAVVVTKSTVPLGTNRQVKQRFPKPTRTLNLTLLQTLSSYEKARQSMTLCILIAWWLVCKTSALQK